MIRYARESIRTVLEEIKPLLRAHWVEIAHYKDIPLLPQWAGYQRAEQEDKLRIYTVRNPDLIGYAVYAVAPAIHYSSTLIAVQDVLYLAPEHRHGRVGWRLIEFADTELRAEGVQVVVQHQKIAHPTLGKILERMGYEQQDIIWTRRL